MIGVNRDIDWDEIADLEDRFKGWIKANISDIDAKLSSNLKPASIRVYQLNHLPQGRILALSCAKTTGGSNRKFKVFAVIDPRIANPAYFSNTEVIGLISDRIARSLGAGKTYTSSIAAKLLHQKVFPVTFQGLFEGNHAESLKVNLAFKKKMGDRFTPNYQVLYWLGTFWNVAEPKYLAWLIWLLYENRNSCQDELSALHRMMHVGGWIEAMQELLKFSPAHNLKSPELAGIN